MSVGYVGWFSPSTGRRSGQYVTSSELRLYSDLRAQNQRLLTLDPESLHMTK